CMQGLEFPYIF
nr:immunoglobulin light chain junction region [Macaca mulatta]MOX52424.1 immunoglobulin light chain junction region [Macaca mulatta]